MQISGATTRDRLRTMFMVLLLTAVSACSEKTEDRASQYPTEQYEYVTPDTTKLRNGGTVYVPVYSHSYIVNGKRPTDFAATLSIRSTDVNDSIFIAGVRYYNSKGKLLKRYIDKTLLLKPMHSTEFIVAENDRAGGAGAYFIVNWLSKEGVNPPIIQAVMLSSFNGLGYSLKTDGVTIPGN